MPKATIEPREPLVRIPHKGDGYTLWTLAEAKELNESLGAAIRQAEHTSLRISVTYGDDLLEQSLRLLLRWRDGRSLVLPDSMTTAVAIDCIRAVLGVEDDQ